MTDTNDYPTFDEEDRSIFAIQESRLRADKMQEVLVPKLREIARMAFAQIESVFKVDPFSIASDSISPEHRPDAAKTRDFDEASVGLVMRQIEGKYHYLKLRFHLSDSTLVPMMEARRPVESEAFLGVLRDYKDEVLRLFADLEIRVWSEEARDASLSNENVIESMRVNHRKQWWLSGLHGRLAGYPIDLDDYGDFLVDQFVGMFPIFQATCERLAGIEDRFRDYFQSYLNAIGGEVDEEDEDNGSDDSGDKDLGDSLNPEQSAIEGDIVHAMIRHRRREQWLREQKIKEVQGATGRLRCEVPGCGFDFFEVYGERGLGFAHVHHNQPLGDRTEPSETKLSDLTIVCANCHAMLHRGDDIPPLSELIPKRA
jgi:hypothetical protein